MRFARSTCFSWCFVLVAWATCASRAAAQGGYTKDVFPDLGLTLERARDYEQVPLQPDEEWSVLHYAEKVPKNPRERRTLRPELFVLWIDWVPDPAALPRTDSGVPGGPNETPTDKKEGRGGSNHDQPDEPAAPLPINTFVRYAEQRLKAYQLVEPEPQKARDGFQVHTVELQELEPSQPEVRGFAYVMEAQHTRTIVLLGFCARADLDKQSKIWRYMGDHLDVADPAAIDLAKLQRKYAHSELRGVDYRVRIRSKLVRGWQAEDTANFIVVYHTPDQPLVRKILNDLEILHDEYEKLFPPAAPIEAVSTVRICRDQGEYRLYGGMPRTAGYWNSATEELVLYDASVQVKGNRPQVDGTFIALYHEAFHQFIHYSTGELPPHSWFNEGTGDYFAGARVSGGKVTRIGPNPWRVRLIKDAVATGAAVPWKDLLRFEQVEYYDPARVSLCYAEGWSLIYFLRTAKIVKARPEWAAILPTYFETLKAAFAEELAALGPDRAKLDGPRFEAGKRARDRALDRAFASVDVAELENAWKDFVRELADD
ncbi:MAG: DUF1570 domain-containing protein [Planctomycetes bacterium]|nr:DUF1570 domain-containing protein [Planctomycetota bacterium]